MSGKKKQVLGKNQTFQKKLTQRRGSEGNRLPGLNKKTVRLGAWDSKKKA